MPAPVPRVSLVDSTLSALTNAIEDGRWGVGSRLPRETELSEQLGVGRNTVREAIRVLAYKGMLEVRQGDGTYVRSQRDQSHTLQVLKSADWRDHLELRALLESEVARFAAARRTAQDLREMKRCLKQRGERADHASEAKFFDADAKFHLAIAKASHNAALEELFRFFFFSTEERLKGEFEFTAAKGLAPGFDHHHDLMAAIESGDEAGAVAAAQAITASSIAWMKQEPSAG